MSRDPWDGKGKLAFTEKFGHAAIVYNTFWVVEAIPSGVSLGQNNWETNHKKMTAVTVKTTKVAEDAAAADYAKKQVGKPYNKWFYDMATRAKFYCSQLVWAAFKDKYRIDLNTPEWDYPVLGKAIAPTELISTPLTSTIYTKG